MLSRRHLRIKVMQTIFAQSSDGTDLPIAEKQLLASVRSIWDLYIHQLAFICEVHKAALDRIEEGRAKKLPTEEDIKPNLRFVENQYLVALTESSALLKEIGRCHPNWHEERELVRRVLTEFRSSFEFINYMNAEAPNAKEHRNILRKLFVDHMHQNEHLISIYEEKNINWSSDLDQVDLMVDRFLSGIKSDPEAMELSVLMRDEKEDIQFVKDLFRKTIVHNAELSELISGKTQNWESDRIANTDMLLMKMAICEFIHIPSVPLKVTMNEYIEISKEYSTPKSAVFINGILDRVLEDLKSAGKIKKTGKGLIQS